jgi:hypothetical protein
MCVSYGVLTIVVLIFFGGAGPLGLSGRGSATLPDDSGMVAIAHTLLPQWMFLVLVLLQAHGLCTSSSTISPKFQ